MSSEIIDFRTASALRRKIEAANDERTDLGASIDFAVWLHDIVMDGLRSGRFSNHEHGPAAALADVFSALQKLGTDYVDIAEEHFELVYGSDPYTFVSRLARHNPKHSHC